MNTNLARVDNDVLEGELLDAEALTPAELDAELTEQRADYRVIARLLFAAEAGDCRTVRHEVLRIADEAPPLYPQAVAHLLDYAGDNAFIVVGRAAAALRSAGVGAARIAEFLASATSGDANYLVRTVARWVTVR